MIFIYSGNEKEAERCAEKYNLTSTEWKFLAHFENLYGLTTPTVWAFGGWVHRHDSMRMQQLVDERGGSFKILHESNLGWSRI